MNTTFALKNFRVFDKQGATFNLAPLTVLTGCNSSGKSSLVKAFLLLRDVFEHLRKNNIADCKLNFGNKLAKLGGFDLVRNNRSRKGSQMVFEYTVTPTCLGKDLSVELTFAAEEKDSLNNGWLKEIRIKLVGTNEILMHACVNGQYVDIKKVDLSIIRNAFLISALKRLIYITAYNTDTRDSQIIDKEISHINELLDALGNIVSEDECETIVKNTKKIFGAFYEHGIEMDCEYDEQQVLNSIRTGVLFYMPIFDWVKGVEKSKVRSIIYEKIGNKINELDSTSSLSLDKILSDFETSKHDTLLAYFKEKEDASLSFTNKGGAPDIRMDYNISMQKVADIKYCTNYCRRYYNRQNDLYNFGKRNVQKSKFLRPCRNSV